MKRESFLGTEFIKDVQRNRFPVLLIDKVTDLEPGVKATSVKCFTNGEWFFQGHFDDEAVVPGFVTIEALTQSFLMTFLSLEGNRGKKTSFVKIHSATFSLKIVPGDVLVIESELDSFSRGLAQGKSIGFVEGRVACELRLSVAIPDQLNAVLPKNRHG